MLITRIYFTFGCPTPKFGTRAKFNVYQNQAHSFFIIMEQKLATLVKEQIALAHHIKPHSLPYINTYCQQMFLYHQCSKKSIPQSRNSKLK